MGLAAEATLIVAMVIGNSTPMLQEKGSAFMLALIIGLVLARLNLLHREAVAEEERNQEETPEPASSGVAGRTWFLPGAAGR